LKITATPHLTLPGGPEVGDTTSTKKRIFEDKGVETLKNEDSPAKINAKKGGRNPRKNNEVAAEEP
jgi:hypothetical protein